MACEFARWLIDKEYLLGNTYTALECHRIMKVGKMCRELKDSGIPRGLSSYKIDFICSIVEAVATLGHKDFGWALIYPKVDLSSMRDSLRRKIKRMEAKNAA